MKVLVAGVESGSIHALDFNLGSDYEKGTQMLSNEIFAKEGRSSYIQKMIVIQHKNDRYVVVARKGPIFQLFRASDMKLTMEWKLPIPVPAGAIVGLQYEGGKIYTCGVFGNLMIRDLECSSKYGTGSITHPVSCFKIHPHQVGVAAYAGKGNDLELIQISRLDAPETHSDTDDNETVWPRISHLWKARNVRKDEFGDAAPVWISDLLFMDVFRPADRGWRIAAVTRFGQLRVYETCRSKRPIVNVRLSEFPLVSIEQGTEPDEVICTDIQHNCSIVRASTGVILNQLKLKVGGQLSTNLYIPPLSRNTSNRRPQTEEPWTPYDHLGEGEEISDNTSSSSSSGITTDASLSETDNAVVDEDGSEMSIVEDQNYCRSSETVIDSASTNNSSQGLTTQNISGSRPLMLCGGLDNNLRIYDLTNGILQGIVSIGERISAVAILDFNEISTFNPKNKRNAEPINTRRSKRRHET